MLRLFPVDLLFDLLRVILPLGMFAWLAELGTRRARRHPLVLAAATAAVATIGLQHGIAFLQNPAFRPRSLHDLVFGDVYVLIWACFSIGIAALTFAKLRSATRKRRAMWSILNGALASSIGLWLALMAVCMLGLGCI